MRNARCFFSKPPIWASKINPKNVLLQDNNLNLEREILVQRGTLDFSTFEKMGGRNPKAECEKRKAELSALSLVNEKTEVVENFYLN